MKRPLRRWALAAIVMAALAVPRAAGADERPSTGRLVLAGSLMGVPAYFLGVTWHEGSHAVVARAFGAEITEFNVLPGRHPRTGAFYFGYVSYRGKLTTNQKALFFLAPRLIDMALLGGYGALLATDTLPSNHYGQVGLAVLATAAWVDFSKDVFRTSPHNDVVRFHLLYDRKSEWQRLPWRALHVGLIAAGGYAVARGYVEIFDDEDPETATRVMLVPVMQGRF